MVKKLLFKLFAVTLFLGCLFCVNSAWSQTVSVTITSANTPGTNGVTASPLQSNQSNVVVLGFTIQVSGGSATFTKFILGASGNDNAGNCFSGAKLYRSQQGSVTYAGAQFVKDVPNSTYMGIDVTETIPNNSSYTYFLVANLNVLAYLLPTNLRFNFAGAVRPYVDQYNPHTEFGPTINGINYSVTAPPPVAITFAANTNGVTSQTTLLNSQADVVLHGVTLTTNVVTSINNPVIEYTATNLNNNPNGYFGSYKLYLATTSGAGSYSSAQLIQNVNFTQNNNVIVARTTNTNIALSPGTNYTFYLVATCNFPNTLPSSPTVINFSRIFSDSPVVSYTNSASGTSKSYTLSHGTLTVSDNNSNPAAGITPGALSYGQTGIVLFSFSITAQGNFTVSDINIPSSKDMKAIFKGSTALLYRSTDGTFANAQPMSGVALNFNGGFQGVKISSVSQAFTSSASTTYYYFLVADFNESISYTNPGSVQYNFATGQSLTAITTDKGTYAANTTQGKNFVIVDVYDWCGCDNSGGSKTSWTNVNNFRPFNQGTAASTLPAGNTIVYIGHIAYTEPPTIAASTNFGGLIFGSAMATPVVNISSGQTLTLSTSLSVLGGATGTINGPGTITLANTATSNLAVGTTLNLNNTTISTAGIFTAGAGSVINLAGNSTINNTGTFTLASNASGTAAIGRLLDNSAMNGTYVVQRYFTGGFLSNRGWRLMSFPVNTTSARPVTSAATSDFTSLKTNLLITGKDGSSVGWDQPSGYTANGPTILFYSNAGTGSFTIPTTFASTTSKAGQGFYFYFRGNRSNALSKLVRPAPEANFAPPEAGVVGLQSGTLNQQGFTYTLSNAGTGYNLVGNPYASSITIPADAVTSGVLTGTTGSIYTFDPSGNSMSANSLPVTIASGQGFFVKSNAPTSSITFSENLKSSGQPISLLMGTPLNDVSPGSIKLKMVQDSANYDFAQLRFANDYVENYIDTEDADDLNANGQTVFFGAMTADKRLVGIASQPLNKKNTSVFLSVNDNSSGVFSINKVDISNIPDKYDVWLMDRFKKDSLDLRANTTYNFNLDKSNPLTYGDSRFEVVIRIKPLPPYKLITFNGQRNAAGNVLKWSTQNEYDFTYFELQRSFDNKTFEGVNNSLSNSAGNYTFTDRNSGPLVYYRLKQTDINDAVSYSTIIIVKQDEADQTFSLYPNPVNNFLKFDLKDDVKGTINMSIYNSVGRLVSSSSHSSKTGQENVSSLLPGSYTVELVDNSSKKRLASTKFIKQ